MRSTAVGSMVVCAWVMTGAGVPGSIAHAEQAAVAASVASPASAALNAAASDPAETEPAEIPFASAHAAGPSTPSATNAWGGERTGKEATLSDRVVSYQITADLDAAKHAVSATEHMTWRNRSDRQVKRVYFHLYLNGFKNNGTTWFTERKVLTAHGQSRGAA